MALKVAGNVRIEDLDKGFFDQLQQSKGEIDKVLADTANFVRDEAKRTSDFIDKTGNLRKSIRKRKSKFVDGGYIVIASGRNRGKDKGFHAHLVEFGHLKVLWGRRTSEHVAPRPFMRNALERGIAYLRSKIGGKK